jgi:hypothetical protein
LGELPRLIICQHTLDCRIHRIRRGNLVRYGGICIGNSFLVVLFYLFIIYFILRFNAFVLGFSLCHGGG